MCVRVLAANPLWLFDDSKKREGGLFNAISIDTVHGYVAGKNQKILTWKISRFLHRCAQDKPYGRMSSKNLETKFDVLSCPASHGGIDCT